MPNIQNPVRLPKTRGNTSTRQPARRSAPSDPADSRLDSAGDDFQEPSAFARLPSHEEIAARAYCISEARRKTGELGDELSDWFQAEAEILRGRG
jgi:hypothetical protein